MTLLLSRASVEARRAVAAGPLEAIADGLAAELEPLMSRELFIPHEKALLSRAGGRCPRDGVYLEFDPQSPHAHRCPICGDVFHGELHDRFWIYWYQLWVIERAVHAALLAVLGRGVRFAALATSILERYTELYLRYPNSDNVLGPTRLFFSTYIESIWLLNLAIAVDLLEQHDAASSLLSGRVRERIVEPSLALISSYDEGASNRQVWNDAAMLAASILLGRTSDAERAVFGSSGIVSHLDGGLLSDGTWYEGENYHLFAHRGLWYGVTMAETAGMTMPSPLLDRFQEGFVTPFLTALPDMTLPSRRDSQYAISLRQPRFAELCELGLARHRGADDPRLIGALQRLYEDDVPRGDIGRSQSTADVERNLPPTRLSRADLGWRSLLCARPALPPLKAHAPGTVLLSGQGIVVFRRNGGRSYVALDYGRSGGGHGHPDRLNVLLVDGATRWLDDYGTGSYVDPSLHWYRSTLAHNAPLFGGRSQTLIDGTLAAFAEDNAAAWVEGKAVGVAPGVQVARTLVVMGDYLVDELSWRGESATTLDLPLHVDAELVTAGAELDDVVPYETLDGEHGLEDGFPFLRDVTALTPPVASPVQLRARAGDGRQLDVFAAASTPVSWWRAIAPGAPGSPARAFVILRTRAVAGWIRMVWSWRAAVTRVRFPDGLIVERSDGATHTHARRGAGWRVEIETAGARHTIDLPRGVDPRASDDRGGSGIVEAPRRVPAVLTRTGVDVFDLGQSAYRRSEQSWDEADQPTARVTLSREGNDVVVAVDVCKRGPLTFAPRSAENTLDNEEPDINGDGVQLYVAAGSDASGWILVPDDVNNGRGPVRARGISGWTSPRAIQAMWERTDGGYRLRARVDVADVVAVRGVVGVDVIVNEMPAGRARRRGQLVLSGGAGEFVYLRGDRHERSRLLHFQLPP